jgi:hypothetical protein
MRPANTAEKTFFWQISLTDLMIISQTVLLQLQELLTFITHY